jgi:hypothetical protein
MHTSDYNGPRLVQQALAGARGRPYWANMPATVDVFDPRVFAGGIPHDAFRRLRDEEPVAWQPEDAVGEWPAGPGFWAVTR